MLQLIVLRRSRQSCLHLLAAFGDSRNRINVSLSIIAISSHELCSIEVRLVRKSFRCGRPLAI